MPSPRHSNDDVAAALAAMGTATPSPQPSPAPTPLPPTPRPNPKPQPASPFPAIPNRQTGSGQPAQIPQNLAQKVVLAQRAPAGSGLIETLLPTVITLGVLLIGTAAASRMLGDTWAIAALPRWVVVLILVTGLILLMIAALNIALTRRTVGETGRGAAGRRR